LLFHVRNCIGDDTKSASMIHPARRAASPALFAVDDICITAKDRVKSASAIE
jgi:hypothetical protein